MSQCYKNPSMLIKGVEIVMKELSIREARQSLSHLDQLLELEGEVMITRRGEPIARVIPISRKRSIPRTVFQRIREYAGGFRSNGRGVWGRYRS